MFGVKMASIQQANVSKHKNGHNSVHLTDIEVKYEVVENHRLQAQHLHLSFTRVVSLLSLQFYLNTIDV